MKLVYYLGVICSLQHPGLKIHKGKKWTKTEFNNNKTIIFIFFIGAMLIITMRFQPITNSHVSGET